MVKNYSHRGITWIDAESPTREEADSLAKAYGLHPVVADELLVPSKAAEAVIHKNYAYLALRFPLRVRSGDRHLIEEKEVDFVIGRDFVITAHFSPVGPLHAFEKSFEANAILDKEKSPDHAGHLFYAMMRRLYTRLLSDLEAIKKELTAAEAGIFGGREKDMVEALSSLSRAALDFRQACRSQYEILESLEKASPGLFDESFAAYVADVRNDFILVRDSVANGRELATELRETNDSLLTTKQNETIKVLTVVAFVTFPLSLVVELFSMNTVHTPIVGGPYDFEIILGIMAGMSLLMIWYFKHKKWL